MKDSFSLKAIFLLSLILGIFPALSAVTISGTIKDKKNQPLPYANIFIKNSYDGASADANGNYSFTTDETGTIISNQRQLKIG